GIADPAIAFLLGGAVPIGPEAVAAVGPGKAVREPRFLVGTRAFDEAAVRGDGVEIAVAGTAEGFGHHFAVAHRERGVAGFAEPPQQLVDDPKVGPRLARRLD